MSPKKVHIKPIEFDTFNNYKMKPKTEQCFCKSYYDDNGILQDCACGKCDKPKMTEEEIIHEFERNLDMFIENKEEHYYDCNAETNGMLCCLDTGKRGRKKILELLSLALLSQREQLKKEIEGLINNKRNMASVAYEKCRMEEYEYLMHEVFTLEEALKILKTK